MVEQQQQQQQLNLPSTQSLVTGLDKAKTVAAVSAEQAPVSQRGQLLASDTADVITSAQQLLVNKNADDKLQRVAAQALDLGKEQVSTTAGAGPSVGGIVGSQIPQQQTQQLREAITNLRDVTMLLIRSGQFRQLVFDSIRLFGITVQRVGERKQAGKPITGEQYEPNVPLSDDEKQQLDDRLRSLLRTISQHEQYNRAINILFDLIGSVQQQGAMVGSSIVNDTRMQIIMSDSQALFGEFVGHYTLQTFLDVAKALINEIRSDAQLRMVFSNLRSSVNDAVQNPDAFYDDQIRRDQLRNQFYQARDMGDGMSLSARWRFKKVGDRFTLKLKDLDVDIDKIKLNIHEARHAMIDRVAKTLFKGAIRSRIEWAIENKLRQILLQVDQTFNDSVLNNRQWIQQATVRANEQLKTGFERGGVIKEKVQQGLSNLGSNVQQGISDFTSGTSGVASTGPIGTTAGTGIGTSNLGAGTVGFQQKPIVGATGFTGTTPQGSNV